MQNELKTFLEEEKEVIKTYSFSENKTFQNWIQDHDQRFIQKVVEIVKKEIEKAKCTCVNSDCLIKETHKEIETLLNKLTI